MATRHSALVSERIHCRIGRTFLGVLLDLETPVGPLLLELAVDLRVVGRVRVVAERVLELLRELEEEVVLGVVAEFVVEDTVVTPMLAST